MNIKACKHAISIIEEYEELAKYSEAFVSDLEQMSAANNETSYEGFKRAINSVSYATLARVSAKGFDDETVLAQETIKQIRKAYKADIDNNIRSAFAQSIEEMHDNMHRCEGNFSCSYW